MNYRFRSKSKKDKENTMNQIYPRPHDKQTVYLKDIVTGPNIEVGDYTIPAIQSGNLAALEDVE